MHYANPSVHPPHDDKQCAFTRAQSQIDIAFVVAVIQLQKDLHRGVVAKGGQEMQKRTTTEVQRRWMHLLIYAN